MVTNCFSKSGNKQKDYCTTLVFAKYIQLGIGITCSILNVYLKHTMTTWMVYTVYICMLLYLFLMYIYVHTGMHNHKQF